MNIYVDFDDCLCETARFFSHLVKELFDMDVPYEGITDFNLQKSYSLSDEDYEHMMITAHKPESLLTFEETPLACETLNEWIDAGHNVSVITGRPFVAYEASRLWLDRHGLDRAKLYCLNKYGRDSFIKNSEFSLEVEDYLKMHFDLAVEDSPTAFKFFSHLPELKVMVIDRPWNKDCTFPNENYMRCYDWETIRRMV
ncbi:MAG: 2-dehydropantoate 2-reductase [Lachnospiraceae bacterium]|nr:2-dehydropantoate 2-reductase [Lachnospiraceae bacterium]